MASIWLYALPFHPHVPPSLSLSLLFLWAFLTRIAWGPIEFDCLFLSPCWLYLLTSKCMWQEFKVKKP